MKKIILSAVVLLLNFNFALAQDQKKLPTKVVITQSSSSGLSNAYAHLEKFADKKNILMTPIYKPGANGLIGINYASRQNDVLVLSTITDYLNAPSGKNFKPVGVINEVELVLIASKKSNIKNIDDLVTVEKNYPGKLNWAQTSTAQEVIINQPAAALRATFIVDPDNVIQHVTVNNLDVGRSPDETLRILDALQTGELCPCNRAIGGETL